jgi:hypothetical protein
MGIIIVDDKTKSKRLRLAKIAQRRLHGDTNVWNGRLPEEQEGVQESASMTAYVRRADILT